MTPRPYVPYVASLERWLIIIIVAGAAFFVSPASKESFRAPKELLFHLLTWIAIALFTIRWAAGDRPPLRRLERRLLPIVLAIVGWTALTSLTSTNPAVSQSALLHAGLAAAYFWMALRVACETRFDGNFVIVILLSLPNALLAILQRHQIWSPFTLENLGERMTVVGLLGNPNDLGGFLAACAVIHLSVIVSGAGISRVMHTISFAFACYAIAATESATALMALLIAGAIIVVPSYRSRSKKLVAVGILFSFVALIAIPLAIYERGHLVEKWEATQRGSITDLFGNRLLAYAAAWVMFRDHPVVGVGPGTFGWHYMRSVKEARHEFPDLPFYSGAQRIFGEAHSDFLEVLAETGLPGLVLTILALGILVMKTAPSSSAARLRIALAVSLMVQMAVNFPLQITGILVLYLYLGAQVIAWQESFDP